MNEICCKFQIFKSDHYIVAIKMGASRSHSMQLCPPKFFTPFPKFIIRYLDEFSNHFQHMFGLDEEDDLEIQFSATLGKNQSKPFDGLLLVICWLAKSSGFKNPELLTNHHIIFMKNDGFHMIFQ